MKRRVVIMVLVGIFLLSLTGAGILLNRGSAGAGRGVSEGVQKIALASENGERVDEVVYEKDESQSLTQKSQIESEDDIIPLFGNSIDKLTDKRIRKLYGIIGNGCSALADYYESGYYKEKSKDIAEHPENYSKWYILDFKAREELAMEAIKVYRELLRELRENPQNWREVWEKYKEFELDNRPKYFNVRYDWRIKEKWFFETDEGKVHAKRNGIDRADVEIWKKDYEEILEKSRKETENMLREFAKKIGIEY
ncbi:hypothetical protein [Caldicellulosiruptor morganii]|uniref:Uncharacterized protein n=1 Tax=Caldicellulosiruptor morganii TaxID=1387555 RepID=A0ABY7BKU4_9FIRM|nr:hypothetical protein [Caldicellulosiruptor morganii]WAM33209.1 hypothetical protein OTK00_001692 [Caldicellulosiruptor morganii]